MLKLKFAIELVAVFIAGTLLGVTAYYIGHLAGAEDDIALTIDFFLSLVIGAVGTMFVIERNL